MGKDEKDNGTRKKGKCLKGREIKVWKGERGKGSGEKWVAENRTRKKQRE